MSSDYKRMLCRKFSQSKATQTFEIVKNPILVLWRYINLIAPLSTLAVSVWWCLYEFIERSALKSHCKTSFYLSMCKTIDDWFGTISPFLLFQGCILKIYFSFFFLALMPKELQNFPVCCLWLLNSLTDKMPREIYAHPRSFFFFSTLESLFFILNLSQSLRELW